MDNDTTDAPVERVAWLTARYFSIRRSNARFAGMTDAEVRAEAARQAEAEMERERLATIRRAETAQRKAERAAEMEALALRAGVKPDEAREALRRDARRRREDAIGRASAHLALPARPPSGVSPERLDKYARAAIANMEPDGSWPTEEALANALGVSDRAVRDVGWDRIKARGTELLGSGGTSG